LSFTDYKEKLQTLKESSLEFDREKLEKFIYNALFQFDSGEKLTLSL